MIFFTYSNVCLCSKSVRHSLIYGVRVRQKKESFDLDPPVNNFFSWIMIIKKKKRRLYKYNSIGFTMTDYFDRLRGH